MYTFTRERIEEDIFSMPISQTQDVAHHGHNSSRAAVRGAAAVPENSKKLQIRKTCRGPINIRAKWAIP